MPEHDHERRHDDRNEDARAIHGLTHVLADWLAESKMQFQWMVTHHHFATKHDIEIITTKLNLIMASQIENTAKLTAVVTQLQKISVESSTTLAKVDELKAIIAQGEQISPELQAAIDAVAAQVQLVDDLTPDITSGSGVA